MSALEGRMFPHRQSTIKNLPVALREHPHYQEAYRASMALPRDKAESTSKYIPMRQDDREARRSNGPLLPKKIYK